MEDLLEKKLEGNDEDEVRVGDNAPADTENLIKENSNTEELPPSDTSAQETEPQANPAMEPQIVEENGATETSIKTFTQDEVDKLIGDTRVKTREKTFKYVYDRYGVANEEEMDDLVSNAQRYDTQKEMYDEDKLAWDEERKSWNSERDETNSRLTEMSEQIALMQSGIDPERYEDAKLILRGKGMEVTVDNINAQLETHPEWKKADKQTMEVENSVTENQPENQPEKQFENQPEKVTTRIKALGNEPQPVPEMTEEEEAEKLFKMNFKK